MGMGMRKQDEEAAAAGKRSEMQRDAEGSTRVAYKSKKKITGEDSICSQCREDSWKSCGMQRDAEEPTGARRKAKKQQKKQGKSKAPAVGSYQIGEMCYEGVTLQHASKLFRQHQERIEKKDRKKGSPEQRDNAQLSQMETQQPVTSPETTEEAVNNEALNKEALNKEALNKEAVNNEALNKEALKKESLNKEALNKEAVNTEPLNMEALKKEAQNILNSYQSEKSSETAPVPAAYSRMRPEYREKLMKHNQERKALMAAFNQAAPGANKRSQNPAGGDGKPPDEAHRKRLEMMRIRRDRQLDEEIQQALLRVKAMLIHNETTRISEETLRLLKDVSTYKFQVLEDQGGGDDDEKADSSAPETVAEEMDHELERFASYSDHWEDTWSKSCGTFTQATLLSSMQFTHYTPGRISWTDRSTTQTLQIISIQLTQLADDLEFPLSVYGVVAVRDMVDRNRNVLFFRPSREAQQVKQNDNFLHLVGPSRAIVFANEVWIEIELRVKGAAADSRDKPLMNCAHRYHGEMPGVATICFKNALCTLELCLQPVENAVQATILGVHVAKDDGSWPFQYGGLVACAPHSGKLRITDHKITSDIDTSSTQIVLIESKDDAMPQGQLGYVLLRRQVVSVNIDGRLDVVIKAYSKSGAIVAETRVLFEPRMSHISLKKFALGDNAQGAVTVAWSRVARSLAGASHELNGRLIT